MNVWYLQQLTVRNQMVLPNLLTSYKGGSLPSVSRSLIPRLQESETDLDNRIILLSLPGTPAHQLTSQMMWPIIALVSHSPARDDAEGIEAGFDGTSDSLRIELTYQLSKFSFSRNFHVLLSL